MKRTKRVQEVGTFQEGIFSRWDGIFRLRLYPDGEAYAESPSKCVRIAPDDPMHPKHRLFVREVYLR